MSTAPSPSRVLERPALAADYAAVRALTLALAEPLSPEDQMVQAIPEASPTKWHLAHTTWFFETFVLEPNERGFQPFDAAFGYLFNSYYEAIGDRIARPRRGILSRPPLRRVLEYRRQVDERVRRLLEADVPAEARDRVVLGLNHEQQHQELLLTDAKSALGANPTRPSYRPEPPAATEAAVPPLRWCAFEGGTVDVGHAGAGFAYDNEGPRHRALLRPYRLASRAVTNGEWREFVEDGGYERPELWLSDGFEVVRSEGWSAPLYWEERDGSWWQYTLGGMRKVVAADPVCHVSHYEADAFARWAGARLPTEVEWEAAAASLPVEGNLLRVDAERLAPAPAVEDSTASPLQMFGDVWEWTSSAYLGYPGYRPPPGAIGEYNGKFMVNQTVLRGGSFATPASHLRATYRNFFPSHTRWQFSGVRLARDA